MWWKAETHSLARIADRVSTVYVEAASVDRASNAVTVTDKAGVVHIPAAGIACFLVGPGTNVTHGAVQLLADSGTAVCWTGQNGVRMYASGISTAQSARFLLRQAWLVSDHQRRLGVARAMYAMRFPGEDVGKLSMQQLRGREGARVRRAYRLHSSRSGVAWHGRQYVPGQAFAAGDDVNRLLSALNTSLYGVCHAAIAGIGASPALGFVHTGAAISFVLDIADLYKANTTIPAAFDLAAQGASSERDARLHFREIVVRENLMHNIVNDLRHLLTGTKPDYAEDEPEPSRLIDEEGDTPSGVNYAPADAKEWDDPWQ